MNLIQLIACIGLITGCFVLLHISPMDFTEGVFRRITSKPKSIRSEVNESTRRKKKSFLRREIEETQTILRMTGRAAKFPMVCALSLLLFLVGAAFALTLGNLFLVPVLAVGMMFVPFWFIRLTANHYKKNIAAELETALSIITTAYLRNEDIQTAVEENIDYLNPPVRSVFVEFLTRIKLVDPDVDAALQDMGTKIDNAVFREWVAALLTCRHDRGLKTILTPIVAKLSDMRIVNGELENLVFEPRKEFITMQVLVIGNIPLLYWLNQDWYDVLMHTPLGQALLAAIAAVMFISTAAVIKLTQPILISNQEKGYFITATINHGSYIPEALHVERIDDMALYDGDFEAAKAAEQDGVRLIYGMDGIPDGIYIDTPENRELIRKGLGLYPDYRNWRDDFDPSFVAELDVMQ